MSEVVFRRDSCRLCGGTDRELVLPLEPTPIGEAYVPSSRLIEPQACYPMDLFLCRTCGHAEFADVINPEVLYGNYIYQTSILLWLVEHFRSYPEEVVRQVTPAPNAQEIDIGSNDGSLLSSVKDLGLNVLGVDAAREIAHKV